MSRGIGAYANKIMEDESSVIYEYGSYDLNDPVYRKEDRICDGLIEIQKDCFVEPEIHEKLKKMPSGKKKLIKKRIPVPVHYKELIEDGRIVVENCSHCWRTTGDDFQTDVMAGLLLSEIFLQYQKEGKIPESISYNV